MRIFISADMEGVTGTTLWEECDRNHPSYATFAAIMTQEVVAACKGALKAGATEVVVRDAHASGTNIDINSLPEGVKLIRQWSGHPFSMVDGIDDTFDAVMFIGYHSAANRLGNALSHTMSTAVHEIKINGELASEFMLYSYAAALVGVPTVLLSGDEMLCADSKHLHPNVITVPVKSGRGGITFNETPQTTQNWIEEGAYRALKQPFQKQLVSLPNDFTVDIRFKDHVKAHAKSYYPGMEQIDASTLRYRTTSYFEVLRMINFVV